MAKGSTLDETAEKYFGAKPPSNVCIDCSSKKSLSILYTTESGVSVWICRGCRARREAAQRESEAREADRIEIWATMDEWEEE